MEYKKEEIFSPETWFAPRSMLSEKHWKLIDGLWALAGYVVIEKINEKNPISSLTRDQKLFSLEVVLENEVDISPLESHFYEDLVFIKILNGKKLSLASMKGDSKLKIELMESSKDFSKLKSLFESTADPKYCELWYAPNKPFHLLSEWNKDYLFTWALKESPKIPWLSYSIERDSVFFKKKTGEDASNDVFGMKSLVSTAKQKNWKVKESLTEKDYGPQINRVLRDFFNRSLQPPDEKEVLAIWRGDLPRGIYEVTRDSFRYKLRNGKMSHIVMARHLKIAIQGRIIWLD